MGTLSNQVLYTSVPSMLTTEFKLASSKSQCVSASEATWGYGGDVMRSG